MDEIMLKVKKYEGKCEDDFEHIADISYFDHNYYRGFDGDMLYAESDDDCQTDWYLCKMEDGFKKPQLIMHFGYSDIRDEDGIILWNIYEI